MVEHFESTKETFKSVFIWYNFMSNCKSKTDEEQFYYLITIVNVNSTFINYYFLFKYWLTL